MALVRKATPSTFARSETSGALSASDGDILTEELGCRAGKRELAAVVDSDDPKQRAIEALLAAEPAPAESQPGDEGGEGRRGRKKAQKGRRRGKHDEL